MKFQHIFFSPSFYFKVEREGEKVISVHFLVLLLCTLKYQEVGNTRVYFQIAGENSEVNSYFVQLESRIFVIYRNGRTREKRTVHARKCPESVVVQRRSTALTHVTENWE